MLRKFTSYLPRTSSLGRFWGIRFVICSPRPFQPYILQVYNSNLWSHSHKLPDWTRSSKKFPIWFLESNLVLFFTFTFLPKRSGGRTISPVATVVYQNRMRIWLVDGVNLILFEGVPGADDFQRSRYSNQKILGSFFFFFTFFLVSLSFWWQSLIGLDDGGGRVLGNVL